MTRALALLLAAIFASALAGCGGSAVPAAPAQGVAPQSFSFAVARDAANPDNSYPHILVKAAPPWNLAQALADNASLTLVVTATDASGNPLSLNGASIAWAKPALGRLSPAKNGQSAQYVTPASGSGSVTIGVSVQFAGQFQKYAGSATITYSSHG